LDKRRIDMSLGQHPEVTLKEARDKHIDASRMVQQKEHPAGPKAEDNPVVMTFSAAAVKYIELNESGWKTRGMRSNGATPCATTFTPKSEIWLSIK
jgi:hypothetical protein